MAAPYSLDLRHRVLAAYEAGEGSFRELAERFSVSLSFVRDLRRRVRETASAEPKPHGGGARPLLDAAGHERVRRLCAKHPDATVAQLCEFYEKRHRLRVNRSSMSRALARLELTRKKNSSTRVSVRVSVSRG
jgi:transposase